VPREYSAFGIRAAAARKTDDNANRLSFIGKILRVQVAKRCREKQSRRRRNHRYSHKVLPICADAIGALCGGCVEISRFSTSRARILGRVNSHAIFAGV
jgi:hypothetical protein